MDTSEPLLQACAIPFRRDGRALEFCLVTSVGKRRWVFPKGIIDPGETDRETALKEAREEAGIVGQIIGEPLGHYEYRKWDRDLVVVGYLLEIQEVHDEWDEAPLRRRCFLSPAEVDERLTTNSRQRPLFEEALARIKSGAHS